VAELVQDLLRDDGPNVTYGEAEELI